MGRKAVESNAVFIDNLKVPEGDLIGEEGKGFQYLLHGLNPERVLIAAEAIGIGRMRPLGRAAAYARVGAPGTSSAGRSARTRASSTHWPAPGRGWRLPT